MKFATRFAPLVAVEAVDVDGSTIPIPVYFNASLKFQENGHIYTNIHTFRRILVY
jgi:hypothetical protein